MRKHQIVIIITKCRTVCFSLTYVPVPEQAPGAVKGRLHQLEHEL